MIDPKELKIGNYLFDDEGCVIKINGFQPHGHSSRCDESEGCILLFDIYSQDGKIRQGYENESDNCNPIPLTPEWLERFGFIKDEINIGNRLENGYYLGSLLILPTANKESWYAAPYGYPLSHERTTYIHQLQNLYYSLTGKELEITNL